jgi:predicted transcriptional regulator
LSSQERRDRVRIYADILGNIYRIHSSGNRATVTGIQTKVNVPFVRFKEYIEDLEKKGLLRKVETEITLTEKGIQYLREYRKVRDFLEKFGMIGGNKTDAEESF